MKEIKNQPRLSAAETFRAQTATLPAQRPDVHAPGSAVHTGYTGYEQSQPLIRRYAIDDHGGGYQGL